MVWTLLQRSGSAVGRCRPAQGPPSVSPAAVTLPEKEVPPFSCLAGLLEMMRYGVKVLFTIRCPRNIRRHPGDALGISDVTIKVFTPLRS